MCRYYNIKLICTETQAIYTYYTFHIPFNNFAYDHIEQDVGGDYMPPPPPLQAHTHTHARMHACTHTHTHTHTVTHIVTHTHTPLHGMRSPALRPPPLQGRQPGSDRSTEEKKWSMNVTVRHILLTFPRHILCTDTLFFAVLIFWHLWLLLGVKCNKHLYLCIT